MHERAAGPPERADDPPGPRRPGRVPRGAHHRAPRRPDLGAPGQPAITAPACAASWPRSPRCSPPSRPPPCPTRVAQRLDGVLAAESARRDDPATSRWLTARLPRRLSPAAAQALGFPARRPARARPGRRRRGARRGRVRPEPHRRQLGELGRQPGSRRPPRTAQRGPAPSSAAGPENRPSAIPAIEAPASLQVVTSGTDYLPCHAAAAGRARSCSCTPGAPRARRNPRPSRSRGACSG